MHVRVRNMHLHVQLQLLMQQRQSLGSPVWGYKRHIFRYQR